MVFSIKFNEEKNQLLKATRRIGFNEILEAIDNGGLLADIVNSSSDRSGQRLYVVNINDYAYAVPYVVNNLKKEIFLKTAYPSRFLTRKYIKGE